MVLTMYGAVMCGALALLVWAFNGRLNPAGHLFLLSELLHFPIIGIFALVHFNPDYRGGASFFAANVLFLLSETAFALSAYTLSRGNRFRYSIQVCFALLLVCSAVEIIRLYNPHLPYLLYSFVCGVICCFTTYICNFKRDDKNYQSPFWNVLKYIEIIFIFVAIIRTILYFSNEGFSPVERSTQNLLILTTILSLLIFRYIAYQAIWMTSVPPNTDENRLNQNLIRTLQERDRILKKLLVSNRRVGVSALASSVAHQLSQPLTGAALYIEAYKRNLITEGGQTESVMAIERVSNQLKKMASLVLNLRSLFSEAHNNFKPSSVTRLCDEVFEIVSASKIAKDVLFEKEYLSNPIIHGDAVQLQQVLINIIENALQAIQSSQCRDPYIKMHVSQTADHAIVSIEDNAGGIDISKMPLLFQLYETTKDDGVGIGLWLCKVIVEKHSGSISAENTPLGGAKFTVKIPLTGSSI